jgi:hypothetical protein
MGQRLDHLVCVESERAAGLNERDAPQVHPVVERPSRCDNSLMSTSLVSIVHLNGERVSACNTGASVSRDTGIFTNVTVQPGGPSTPDFSDFLDGQEVRYIAHLRLYPARLDGSGP